jgi:DNA modification methylase
MWSSLTDFAGDAATSFRLDVWEDQPAYHNLHGRIQMLPFRLDPRIERGARPARTQIIWRKPRFVISRGHYHWQHEPAWYAVRPGGSAKWRGDRSQSTVWDIAQRDDTGETKHGTQKPVECMRRPIRHHGGKGDDVYDPFVGSGTTIIAAEQLGRRCFAMEISPGYCDVVVQRWEQFTGKNAERQAEVSR